MVEEKVLSKINSYIGPAPNQPCPACGFYWVKNIIRTKGPNATEPATSKHIVKPNAVGVFRSLNKFA